MNAAHQALRDALASAAVFPFHYDAAAGQVTIVALGPGAITNAAFLDQRILPQAAGKSTVALADFDAAASELPARLPNLIFHQGHCGSTLISRLIASASGSRAVREPLVLRTFAELLSDTGAGASTVAPLKAEERLRLFLRCFAHGAAPSVVKASSICTDLAAPLLRSDAQLRALFVFVQPEVFIATMLGGPNNRVDMKAFAGLRRKRLRNVGIETPPAFSLSDGQLAALTWICEAVSFGAAPDDGRCLPVNFDQFLAAPAPSLMAAAAHLGLEIDLEKARAATLGPDMRTYSKAQQYDFSPGLRAEVLQEARQNFGPEINAGLVWLEGLAARHPAARAALEKLGAPEFSAR